MEKSMENKAGNQWKIMMEKSMVKPMENKWKWLIVAIAEDLNPRKFYFIKNFKRIKQI